MERFIESTKMHNQICTTQNITVINPRNQYYGEFIRCPVYELANFFPDHYGSIMIGKGFKHKEKINLSYLRMQ